MSGAATEALSSDDALYDELYDVAGEAKQLGNYIEIDPYPLMNAARERGVIHKGYLREVLGLDWFHRHKMMQSGREGYSTYGFQACEQVFRDNVRLSNRIYHLNPGDDKMLGILEMDNPEHHAYRRAAQSLFIKPRAKTWWRDQWINAIAEHLVAALRGSSRAELNMQLCARLPVHTITLAVGLQGDDALRFRKAVLASISGGLRREAQLEGHATVHRMLLEQIARRRCEPGEDIISWLIAAEVDLPGEGQRPLIDEEIITFCRLLLIAGGGTTWRQFGITLLALLTRRDQLEAVKADRSLLEPAIEESVRWNPTNPTFSRLAVQDVEIAGMHVPAGSVIDICLSAANRDPSRWDYPDEYDIHRPFKQHIGFGIGAHMCLGRNVAVIEMYAGLNALLDHFPDIRLDPDQPTPILTGGLEQRGVSSLPVLLT